MAETTKNKKGFNAVAYALFAGVLVAVILVIISIFAFTTRYTAFDPEKVAQAYTDTIVQTGDGYNAYKNTLVSKNSKFGDFIRNAYMKPYMNNGDDVKQAEFVGTGSDEEAQAIDEVYSAMYDYYVELLTEYGLDDYDAVFSNYFAKLVEVRHQVYGDEYMDDEFMFGAFESNVSQYGRTLTGTDEQIAQDGKTVLQEKTTGKYQEMFADDYKLTTTVKECAELSDDEVKAYVEEYAQRIKPVTESGASKADSLGVADIDEKNKPKTAMVNAFAELDNSESISAVDKCTVEVALENGSVVAVQEVYVVQIGNSWYVDDTNVDTSALYLALNK